jgi:hypothetical protein
MPGEGALTSAQLNLIATRKAIPFAGYLSSGADWQASGGHVGGTLARRIKPCCAFGLYGFLVSGGGSSVSSTSSMILTSAPNFW